MANIAPKKKRVTVAIAPRIVSAFIVMLRATSQDFNFVLSSSNSMLYGGCAFSSVAFLIVI
jgi:hypothetical protein